MFCLIARIICCKQGNDREGFCNKQQRPLMRPTLPSVKTTGFEFPRALVTLLPQQFPPDLFANLAAAVTATVLLSLSAQSTNMAFGKVTEETVYTCTGHPLKSDIANILDWMLNQDFTTAYRSILSRSRQWHIMCPRPDLGTRSQASQHLHLTGSCWGSKMVVGGVLVFSAPKFFLRGSDLGIA